MKPALSTRQAQVAEYVARGLPDKVIAHELGVAIETVRVHIQAAADKIQAASDRPPGMTPRRYRITLWYFGISEAEPN